MKSPTVRGSEKEKKRKEKKRKEKKRKEKKRKEKTTYLIFEYLHPI